MRKTRKHYRPEEKVRILRLHLLEGRPISELCEAHGLHPTQFYQWQKQFFEKGAAAFASRKGKVEERKLASLEAKLRAKDGVIAEIMEEHVLLKKELGES